VRAGETCFLGKGERFRVAFPAPATELIAVCLPAFQPGRCHREEEEEPEQQRQQQAPTAAAQDLKENDPAHLPPGAAASIQHQARQEFNGECGGASIDVDAGSAGSDCVPVDSDLIVYHLCPKAAWDGAVRSGTAFYPPSFFERGGGFTRATTAVPTTLIDPANHRFCATSTGSPIDDEDWVCVELSTLELRKIGIVTRFLRKNPAGSHSIDGDDDKNGSSGTALYHPHIYGGIPTQLPGIVKNVYRVNQRDDGALNGKFLSIDEAANNQVLAMRGTDLNENAVPMIEQEEEDQGLVGFDYRGQESLEYPPLVYQHVLHGW
jgi:hypothetical protein